MIRHNCRARCLAVRVWWATLLGLLMVSIFNTAAWAATRHETPSSPPQEVRIGVLALRGVAQVEVEWTATADYLTKRLSDYQFRIVPLSFDQVEPQVAAGKVDFVIVNPVMHVILAERYGVSPVATMIKRLDDYNASLYGGVIFRRAGQPGTPDLDWLKGKRFLAVDPLSLGGWLAARLRLQEHGIRPDDLANLSFAGTHDAAVLGVLAGQADAGTVRTGVLEQMAAHGQIDLRQIEVIAPVTNGQRQGLRQFPFLRSTRLYPEWPLSRLPEVSERLTQSVSMALVSMPGESPAAQSAGIVGWNAPMTYFPVNDLLRALEMPPFEPAPITLERLQAQQPAVVPLALGSLLVTGGLIGVLYLANRRLRRARNALNEANVTLEARVHERTKALEAIERDLEVQATHDPLTGLLNRRALEARMLEEVNRVNRYGTPLSVLMLDIDFFKKINDSFGHAAGDHVLSALARFLLSTLRNTDVVARYGGEEFVALLPMTRQADAMPLAERLCQRIAEHTIDLGHGKTVRVTVSIGVAAIEATGNACWDALIDTADQAMYRAKQGGRNRVVAAP